MLGIDASGGAFSALDAHTEICFSKLVKNVSNFELTLIQALTPGGAFIGCLLLFFYGHRCISRKYLMYLADLIGFVSTVPMLFISTDSSSFITLLLVLRFIFGFSVALNCSVVPVYIQESTIHDLEGTSGCFVQIFINIGIMSAYIFGGETCQYYQNSQAYLRVILAFPCLICAIRFVLMKKLEKFDSPVFYVSPLTLEKFENFSLMDKEVDTTKKNILMSFTKQIHKSDLEQVNYYKRIVWRSGLNRQSWKTLYLKNLNNDTFKYEHIRPQLCAGLILQLFQQLSGINLIVFFSSNILYFFYQNRKKEGHHIEF